MAATVPSMTRHHFALWAFFQRLTSAAWFLGTDCGFGLEPAIGSLPVGPSRSTVAASSARRRIAGTRDLALPLVRLQAGALAVQLVQFDYELARRLARVHDDQVLAGHLGLVWTVAV